ncbi:DUF6950 family protein [Nitratireductor soli]|uniref:DUF6950 family protein n=1 Tax=Nitratireductor soli TaxID=1670619 RepID=UPI00065E88B2|nr:hypothetical protein [Nitratireductor soli]
MTRFEIATAVIEAELDKAYLPGESDCLFLGLRVADALDPSLGLVERYWRAYTTLAGGHRAMVKAGFKSIEAFLESHLKRCAPAQAQFGDLVILGLPAGSRRADHVAVCIGTRFATKLETGGSLHMIDEVTAAFRTGAPHEPAQW